MILASLLYFYLTNLFFFFKFRSLSQSSGMGVESHTTSKISNTLNKRNNYCFYSNFFMFNYIFFLIFLHIFRVNDPFGIHPMFCFDNFGMYQVFIWTVFNILFFWTMRSVQFDVHPIVKLDYLFTIFNIFYMFNLIFLCNNFYTFVFLLEVLSYLFFYKLILSRSFGFYQSQRKSINSNYFNLIFYHYWASTLSTFLFLFFLLVVIKFYGSCGAGFDLFLSGSLETNQEVFFFSFFCVVFILCFCLKLGFSPFHLFKLHIYKNISYFYLFFYSTYYFLGFFFLISCLYFKFFLLIDRSLPMFFIVITILGIFFAAILLSQHSSLKWFIAISTILSLLNFILILILCNA